MSVAEIEKLATPDGNDSLANDIISSTDLKIIINGGYFCGIAGIRELLNVIMSVLPSFLFPKVSNGCTHVHSKFEEERSGVDLPAPANPH